MANVGILSSKAWQFLENANISDLNDLIFLCRGSIKLIFMNEGKVREKKSHGKYRQLFS